MAQTEFFKQLFKLANELSFNSDFSLYQVNMRSKGNAKRMIVTDCLRLEFSEFIYRKEFYLMVLNGGLRSPANAIIVSFEANGSREET